MEINMEWNSNLEQALESARSSGRAVLLQFHRDECAGCRKMYAGTYTNPDVQQELFRWFIPVRVDIIHDRAIRSRYSAYWTPSFFFMDHNGKMLYSINGYLNAEDFRIVMRLGKAAVDLPRGRYLQVIALMDDGLKRFHENPRAASMLFTRGMAEYLLGREKSTFRGTMEEILEEFPESSEARMWPWEDRP